VKNEIWDECRNEKLTKKKVEYLLIGIKLGKFDAFVCSNCGETIFEGKESKK